jgi:hypothetical protein
MFRLRCGPVISLGTDDVRHHTALRRAGIYIEPTMPEHIARALVGGLVLSLLPGHSGLYTAHC